MALDAPRASPAGALQAGSLQHSATAMPEAGGEREIVPAYKWRDLEIYEDRREHMVVRMRPGLSPGYTDVVVPNATLLSLESTSEFSLSGAVVAPHATTGLGSSARFRNSSSTRAT